MFCATLAVNNKQQQHIHHCWPSYLPSRAVRMTLHQPRVLWHRKLRKMEESAQQTHTHRAPPKEVRKYRKTVNTPLSWAVLMVRRDCKPFRVPVRVMMILEATIYVCLGPCVGLWFYFWDRYASFPLKKPSFFPSKRLVKHDENIVFFLYLSTIDQPQPGPRRRKSGSCTFESN